MDRETVVKELQRVAALLDSRTVSRSLYEQHGTISSAGVEATFGSWNEAISAAGLIPLPPGGLPKSEQRRLERLTERPTGSALHTLSDEELLKDLVRIGKELGRRPSGNQITAKGKFGKDVYQKRWGSVAHAYEIALEKHKAI